MLPVATLVYEKPAESACPEEGPFRAAVGARLGRDPFVARARRRVLVHLSGSGSSWLATVRVDGAEAESSDERRIEANGSCEELAAAAALAVSIAIDPPGAQEVAPEPAPEAKAETKPDTSSSPSPHARRVSMPPVESSWQARAAARLWLGAVPDVSAGPLLGARYRYGWWSLGLAGFFVLPRRESAGDERAVSASLWGVELEPCAHVSVWRGCAVIEGGRLLAEGHGVDVSLTESAWHASAGASAGYAFGLGRVHLVPTLSGSARLRTTTLSLAGQSLWLTPRWFISLGVEAAYRL